MKKTRWYIITYPVEGGTCTEKEWLVAEDTQTAPIIKNKVQEWMDEYSKKYNSVPHFTVMSCPWRE